MSKILIADDEEDLRYFVRRGLVRAGWEVYEADSGEAALEILAQTSCEVILLDLRMGRTDGLALMRQVKEYWPEIMIIIITAYASIDSAIEAVRQGAFDYLRKPCSVHEVVECANRALARKVELGQQRGSPQPEAAAAHPAAPTQLVIRSGELVIEPSKRAVSLAGQAISLTPTEYTILEILARSPGHVISLDQLIRQSLGHEPDHFNDQETLRVHVSNLRRKLGGKYILTARGGYTLVDLSPFS